MLRIAIAQMNSTVGDLMGNAQKIGGHIDAARRQKADIVVFPELAICGYPPEDLLYKENFAKDNLRALKSVIGKTRGITAIVGFVDQGKKGEIYNAAAIIQDGRIKSICHKTELPNYSVFDEKRYFTPGQNKCVYAIGENVFGVNICEDIWKEDGLYDEQADAGAKMLINISASPYYVGKRKERENLLRRRVKRTKTHIVYVNTVGGQDELVFDGGSFVVDPTGRVIASGKQFEEDLFVVDLDIKNPRLSKRNKHVIRLGPLLNVKKEKVQPYLIPLLQPTEEMYKALVLGTRDYIRKNGFKKVVIGLSGGIDSALVAVIACEAIGRENVVGITMPSEFSSSGTRSDAAKLAENLRIQFVEVPIEGIFHTYLFMLKGHFEGKASDIAEENLQARIRGTLLMAFSNKFGWLVLTTGNKSEFAVGYCTLYGDMSGGFAVIKDVPKMKVYEIARFINKQAKGKLIPESIFTRPPTAELRPNQTDQDSLPPYETLDRILTDYIEEHCSVKSIAKREKNIELVKKVIKLVDQSEYKRRQAPPGVKITQRAFGKDWRLPITNKYKEF